MHVDVPLAALAGPGAFVVGLGLVLVIAGAAGGWAMPERIAGRDRVETAVAAAQAGWQTADVAVVATAGGFPDALAASTLASAHRAPLLLTRRASLPSRVADELERLGVQRVLVPGGEKAVSPGVLRQLAGLSTAPGVERLAGSDRFATAAAIATAVGRATGSRRAVVVRGDAFADALAAGAMGLGQPAPPIVLSRRDRLPEASRAALAELGVDRVWLVGGTAALSPGVGRQLEAAGYATRRLAGADRYETSAAVVDALDAQTTIDRLVMATGTTFPDALAAGPLAAQRDALLHLIAPQQPHPTADRVLRRRAGHWAGASVLGGSGAIGEGARAALGRSLRGEPHPEPKAPPESSAAEIAVSTAREQVGKPYRYGATGPAAFDCSGLTSFAWEAAGTVIPRTSRAQFASLSRVPASQRQPGDLVAFGDPVHHIGIFIGDGKMVEAPHSGERVRVGSIHRANRRGFLRPTQ